MDERLTLNNGTVLTGHAIEVDGRLYVYVYNITLAELFELLIVPENTVKIDMNRHGDETEFTGYNHLKVVSEEGGGMVTAVLVKI